MSRLDCIRGGVLSSVNPPKSLQTSLWEKTEFRSQRDDDEEKFHFEALAEKKGIFKEERNSRDFLCFPGGCSFNFFNEKFGSLRTEDKQTAHAQKIYSLRNFAANNEIAGDLHREGAELRLNEMEETSLKKNPLAMNESTSDLLHTELRYIVEMGTGMGWTLK